MKIKKVTRYYSDCGRGFWKKQQAITHDQNCRCWKNPKFKSCVSCKMKNIDHSLEVNNCEHSKNGVAVHKGFDHIRKHCSFYVER